MFYLTEDEFDGVPISVTDRPESESEPSETNFEDVALKNEKRGSLDGTPLRSCGKTGAPAFETAVRGGRWVRVMAGADGPLGVRGPESPSRRSRLSTSRWLKITESSSKALFISGKLIRSDRCTQDLLFLAAWKK